MSIALTAGIQLNSGTYFDYNDPAAADVSIEDIAHALSHVCRFAGHCNHFYSVAQHAVNTSRIVDQEHALTALLHDTAEAFTNDLPTPLKTAVPIFKELEVSIESAMSEKFGFAYPLPPEVRLADLQMLGLEKEALLNTQDDWDILDGIEFQHLAPIINLNLLSPQSAKTMFLARYEELTNGV